MQGLIKAELIGCTKPTGKLLDTDIKDVKDLIAYCARVSNPSNQYNTKTADKLIKYLIANLHWSPLEMASCTLEIECPRDIARQLLRHRSFSFQEFSGRYADATKELSFVIRECRLQDTKNRQNSLETTNSELSTKWYKMQEDCIKASLKAYQWATENGIAKEQARCVLPEGNTMSRLYVQGTIRSWLHYIQVRTHESTQKEHQVLAKEVAKAIAEVFSLDLKEQKE